MKKNSKIIYLAVVLLIVVLMSLLYFIIYKPDKVINDRCIDSHIEYGLWGPNIINCYGIISVSEAWDVPYLYVTDNLHKYEIAQIDNIADFHVAEGRIYIKNSQKDFNFASANGDKIYFKDFLEGSKVVSKQFLNLEDVPSYFIIDYNSGEVQSYRTLDQIPENEKIFFNIK